MTENKFLLLCNLGIVTVSLVTTLCLFWLGAGGNSFLALLGFFCIMSKTGGEDETTKAD